MEKLLDQLVKLFELVTVKGPVFSQTVIDQYVALATMNAIVMFTVAGILYIISAGQPFTSGSFTAASSATANVSTRYLPQWTITSRLSSSLSCLHSLER